MNPMVNAGAIATTSLIPGATGADKWEYVHRGLSRFAGRELEVDERVYQSESATNVRNRGIAHLLFGGIRSVSARYLMPCCSRGSREG